MPIVALCMSVLALLAAVSPGSAAAQDRLARAQVEQWYLDAVHVPEDGSGGVDLLVRVLTATGQPAELIPPWPFELEQDGRRIDPSEVEALPLNETDEGVACVLVVDVSRSVERTFAQAKSASLRLVDRMRPVDQMSIIAFAGQIQRVADFGSAIAEKRARLEGLEIDATLAPGRLYDAIQEGVDQLRRTPGLPKRRFVLVYSDGREGGGSVTSIDALLTQLDRQSGSNVLVYAIAAPNPLFPANLSELRRVAGQTRTELREARSDYDVQGFFEEIWSQMTGSYIVRFRPRMDGQTHELALLMANKVETIAAVYPEGDLPLVAILLVGAAALVLGLLCVWLLVRMRGAGGGRLVVVGTGLEQSFALRRGSNEIGWLDENDIVLASPTVSKHHAIIHVYPNGVEIEDVGSTNGTLVNGMHISRAPLNPGDRLTFGDLEMVYRP